MKDLVSVIVTVDNIESYISTCLDSILKQTHKKIEIIIVYKKVDDHSLKICRYYKDIDKRVNLIVVNDKNKDNLKNIGLKHASGKYVTFIDGGDYVSSDYVEYMLNLMKKEVADIVSTGIYLIDSKPAKNAKIEVYRGKKIMANYMHMKFKSNSYAKMFTKEILKDISFPDTNYYDDFITGYKIFAKAQKLVNSSKQNYQLVLDKLYYKDRITDLDRMKKIESCFDMLTFMEENYKQLVDYCKTKICFEAIDLFKDVKEKVYKKQLFNYIKIYRKYALNDKRIGFKNKMICIRSILGYNFMRFSFYIENVLKKPI